MATITMTTEITTESIIASLAKDADYTALMSIITGIDALVGDWEFTLELIAYFKEEEKKYKEDVNLAEDTPSTIS